MPEISGRPPYCQARCLTCRTVQEPDNLFADCSECGREYCAFCGHTSRHLCESCNRQFETELEDQEWEHENLQEAEVR